MATTTLGFPYGTLDDPPDGASQEQALAAAVDAYIAANVLPASSVLVARDAVITLTASTPTSPASFNLGTLFQRGPSCVYIGSGVIGAKVAGLYRWHATVNWPDTTAVHRRKVSIQVNGTNFGAGACTSWIFGAAGGDTDTAGGLFPVSQANVDANVDGAHVTLVLFQSGSTSMAGVVPATFGIERVG